MSQSTHSTTKRNIFWFRRDLRLADNPALLAAIENREELIAVFILDEKIIKDSGSKRLAYLGQSLRALDESLNNKLYVMTGDPIEVLNSLIKRYGADEVHISQEYEPYGAARDLKVEASGIKLVRTGSIYAVAPGRVLKPSDATPYRVYTPFYKGWCLHGWRKPVAAPKNLRLLLDPRPSRAICYLAMHLVPEATVPNNQGACFHFA